MKNITLSPMLAMLGLGGSEIILILLALVIGPLFIIALVFLVIWLVRRNDRKSPPPLATAAATRRFCHTCGQEMAADAPQGLCAACLMKVALGSEGGNPAGAGQREPAPPPADIARYFPQLEILELLGQGGMGMVYKARQRQLDRLVALKILPANSARDPAFAERFSREARALARLNHPNIVSVYDFGHTGSRWGNAAENPPGAGNPPPHVGDNATGEDFYYFIMEFVDGVNLRQMEHTRRLAPSEALTIVPRICEALQYAHDEGIVHRDIKPENVLIDKKGRVKIADFGLAKLLSQAPKDFRLTDAGRIMGTPHYMAPEQVEHPLDVDHRADIYSLGVVFYEMLTGELPLGKFAAPSHKVQMDVRLDEVVLKSLEKEPSRRYQQVSEVKTQVETIAGTPPAGGIPAKGNDGVQAGQPVTEPRISRTAVVGACWSVFALLAFFSYFVHRSEGGPGRTLSTLAFILVFTLLPLGFTAPFGTTILGWIAVSQIRRSAGKLYGLGLAVFDGLFFPLLVLDALIAGASALALRILGMQMAARARAGEVISPVWYAYWWLPLLALAIMLVTNFLIVRWVWHAVKKPFNGYQPITVEGGSAPAQKPREDRFWKRFAVIITAGVAALILIPVAAILLSILLPAWNRTHDRVAQPPAAVESNFGPMVERVITLGEVQPSGVAFVNLEKAEILQPPFPVEMDANNPLFFFKHNRRLDEWIAASGVDLALHLREKNWGVVPQGTRLIYCEGEVVDGNFLDTIPFSEAQSILTTASTPRGFTVSKGTGVSAYPLTLNYVLKTRRGDCGLLQITGFPNDAPGVKLRYRLAQVSAGTISEPAALFSPVSDPSLGNAAYRLVSTLVKSRQAALGVVQLVDEQHSSVMEIPQLGFYLASPDGLSNVSSQLTWSMEKPANRQTDWRVSLTGTSGSQHFDQTVGLAGNFDHVPLPPMTWWEAVRPERSFWVGPGEWSARQWNTLPLFVARDEQQRILARLQLKLLVCSLRPDAVTLGSEPILRSGNWEQDAQLKTAVGALPPSHSVSGETKRAGARTTGLEFRLVAANGDSVTSADELEDPGDQSGQQKLRVLKEVVLDGAAVASARLESGQQTPGQKNISITLKNSAVRKFSALTAANLDRRLAIVWRGRVLSAPIIRSPISGPNISVSGNLSDAECQVLLDLLNRQSAR